MSGSIFSFFSILLPLKPMEALQTLTSPYQEEKQETVQGALPRVLYVLQLEPDKKFGSLEEYIILVGKAFAREGGMFVPLFSCPPGPGRLKTFQDQGLKGECVDLTRFTWSRLMELVKVVKKYQIDLVHWNFTPPLKNFYVWGLSCLAPRVRHDFTEHISRALPLPDPPRGLKKLFKKLLLWRYRQVWCISRFVENCLHQQQTWHRLVCSLHLVNADRFRPDEEVRRRVREAQGVKDRFVVALIANLIPEKGVDVLLRALAGLPEDVVAWVIGEGREKQHLTDLARELGIQDRVRFLGLQAHVQPYLQAADCMVCPSLWAEGAGLVNLEAQATGLVLVASHIGGIGEYLFEGKSGYLFEPGNHQELAEFLLRLKQDPERRRFMGRQGRAIMVDQFSAQVRLPEILNLYRKG